MAYCLLICWGLGHKGLCELFSCASTAVFCFSSWKVEQVFDSLLVLAPERKAQAAVCCNQPAAADWCCCTWQPGRITEKTRIGVSKRFKYDLIPAATPYIRFTSLVFT